MNDLGRILLVTGALLVVAGLVLMSGFAKGWVGRLPGDINITRDNFSFHFPIVTCLIVSGILTLIFWFLRRH